MFKEGDRVVTGHRLVKFLGRGNFGEVWQATAPGNTYAALKFLNLEQTQGRKEYRAIQPLKHLRHANLLQMTAIWLLDENGEVIPDDVVMAGALILLDTIRGTLTTAPTLPDQHRACTLIIAMPFADKSLDQLLKEYRAKGETGIPRDELWRYMEDAAKAIDFLNSPHHDLGQGPVAIRHCDVKPENLLLMGQSVVLCDFGVSRTILGSSTTRKTTMGGSLAYMAPECLSDEVTPFSDQFSLAISYIELRTGKLPFENESTAALMDQRRRGVLDLSELPKAEATVIRRATSIHPEKRFASAWDMVHALQSTSAPVAGRGRLWVSLAGTVAMAGVVAAAIIWLGPGPNNTILESPPVPSWNESAELAFSLVDSPDVTEAQLQQAVDHLGTAIDRGMPNSLVIYPHPETVTQPNLREIEEASFGFNPFAYNETDKSVAVVQRTKSGLSLCRIGLETEANLVTPFGSQLAFDSIMSFGWLDDRLAIMAEDKERRFVGLLRPGESSNSTWMSKPRGEPLDLCMARSGRRALVVDWNSLQLTTLDDPSRTWQIPESLSDEEEFPLLELSDEGDWLIILTSKIAYVLNLDVAGSPLHRIDLQTAISPNAETLSIQVDDTYGWFTTRMESHDTVNKLVLVRFELSSPANFSLVHQPEGPMDVTFAKLEKRGRAIALSSGYASRHTRYFTDVTQLDKWQDSTLAEASDIVRVCATQLGTSAQSGWAVFATRDGVIYLQNLRDGMPTHEIAKSNYDSPRRIVMDEVHIIIGYDKGAVEILNLPRCRLIYEASLLKNVAPLSSRPSSVIRS